jgi:hypothetical protein
MRAAFFLKYIFSIYIIVVVVRYVLVMFVLTDWSRLESAVVGCSRSRLKLTQRPREYHGFVNPHGKRLREMEGTGTGFNLLTRA